MTIIFLYYMSTKISCIATKKDRNQCTFKKCNDCDIIDYCLKYSINGRSS